MTFRLVAMGLLLAVPLAAQRGGGGAGGGDFGGGAPPAGGKTRFQVVADELKLDRKTQLPAVTELFAAGEKESFAIVEEMIGLRQQMLNVATRGTSDPAGKIPAAYAAAVEKMLALEARLFSETYALLKPDQQARAPKAFAQMAGFYKALPPAPGAAPSGGRFGGRGGGRGGGQ
jgi:hypothetical protein